MVFLFEAHCLWRVGHRREDPMAEAQKRFSRYQRSGVCALARSGQACACGCGDCGPRFWAGEEAGGHADFAIGAKKSN